MRGRALTGDALTLPWPPGGVTAARGANREDARNAATRDASEPAVADFAELFERYEKKIFNLLYRLVGDYDDAADLTSETFVLAMRAQDRFRGEARAYTWLYRIAVNLAKNHFRRRGVRQNVHAHSLDEPAGESGEERQVADWSQAPEKMLETRELQQVLHEAIQTLPEDARLVVVLRDLQGLSYHEMADVLDTTAEIVKARLFRARSALRKRLAAYLAPEA